MQAWPDHVRQVTADLVRAVARRYLDKRASVTGYLIQDTAQPEGKHYVTKLATAPAGVFGRLVFGRCAGLVLLAVALLTLPDRSANATQIERVVSPGGIEAWVVHEPSPLIALEFAILGGADQDPADKPGVAYLAASLWDEGAGDLDAKAFHSRLENKSIELSFSAGRDHVRGSLRTLTINRDEAFDDLRLALTAPRFDTDAVERERTQLVSRMQRQITSSNVHQQPHLVGDRLSQSFVWAAGPRHVRFGRPHQHRRSEILYSAACWRARTSR